MQIAINTACYIGRQTGYALRPFAWGPARSATVAAFSGPAFTEQLAQLAATIQSLGVSNVELWSAHLAPSATPAMVEQASAILAAHGLRVAAYAASLRRPGMSPAELRRAFEIARALGAPLIAGGLHHAYAPTVHALCREHGLRFAVENHPEDEPLEIPGPDRWPRGLVRRRARHRLVPHERLRRAGRRSPSCASTSSTST